MEVIVLVIHLFIALGMIAVILLQRSEGGALGIGGGGGAGGLFSARGAANVLTRTTAYLAAAFFVTSIALTLLARGAGQPASIIDRPSSTQPVPAPGPLDPLSNSPAAPAPAEPAPAQPAPAEPAPTQPQPAEPAAPPAPSAPAAPSPAAETPAAEPAEPPASDAAGEDVPVPVAKPIKP